MAGARGAVNNKQIRHKSIMADDKLCEKKNKEGKGFELTFKERSGGGKTINHTDVWGKCLLREDNFQDNEIGRYLTYSRKSKGASVGRRV